MRFSNIVMLERPGRDKHLFDLFISDEKNKFNRDIDNRTLAKHRRIPLSDKPKEKPRCPYHTAHVMEFTCLEPECRSAPLMCYICKGKKVVNLNFVLNTYLHLVLDV